MRESQSNRKLLTLLAVAVGTFMLLLDVTVVNVALPDIQRALGADFADLQWVVDAYALSLAALILVAGSLADRLGRRRVFLAGLGVFTAASLASGLAGGPTFLNLARAAQGVGGAAMLATSLALLAHAFQGRDRHVALAAWGATSGAAVAVGPLVGGALVETLGWEWIFFVNLPVALVAAVLTVVGVEESRDPQARSVDWKGAATFAGALATLVLALLRGNAEGWGSPLIVGLFASSVALVGLFLLVESRAPRPMLDLTLWRKPTTAGASIAVFTLAWSAFALLAFLSLYLQNVLGHGPLDTGLRLLPITAASFVAAALTGHLAQRLPQRGLLGVGLAICALGLLLMHGVEPGSAWTALLAGFILVGIGVGIVNPTVAGAAIGIVPAARSGMASGLNNTFRLLGVAMGVAVFGALFEHRVEERFAELAPAAPPALVEAVATGNVQAALSTYPSGIRSGLLAAAEEAFASGLNLILLVAVAIAVAGALAAGALVRRRDIVLEDRDESADPTPAARVEGLAPTIGEPRVPQFSGDCAKEATRGLR